MLDNKDLSIEQVSSVYQNIIKFFCKELELVDVLSLHMFMKEGNLFTEQKHVVDQTVVSVTDLLGVTSVPKSQLQEMLHWRTLANLLLLLSHDRQEIFRDVECDTQLSEPHSSQVKGADAHFHPEMLVRRFGVDAVRDVERVVSSDIDFDIMIANLCYPKLWSKKVNFESDKRIKFAFGFHPRLASEFHVGHYEELNHLLIQDHVVALGEVGLDYTCPESQWGAQRVLLRTILPLAVSHHKTLVIHCRERDERSIQAGDDCRTILRKIIPRLHNIHVHCFTGDLRSLKMG